MLAAVDWHVIWQRIFHPDHVFARALYTTVYIAVIAQVMGVLLGLVAALTRSSKIWPVRLLSGIYVLIFRGTPLLVQIFFVYYGANLLLGFTLIPNSLSLGLFSLDGAVVAGILALGVNEGAYMREVIRAGIDSIDPGQMEAAKSLGMRFSLAMRRIILPQAARVIVPPLGNEFNNMLKATSLASVIGLFELTYTAQVYGSQSFSYFELLVVATFYYLILTTVWGYIQNYIERRLDPNRLTATELKAEKGWTLRMMGFGSGGDLLPDSKEFR